MEEQNHISSNIHDTTLDVEKLTLNGDECNSPGPTNLGGPDWPPHDLLQPHSLLEFLSSVGIESMYLSPGTWI
jgi:hypothetical protein